MPSPESTKARSQLSRQAAARCGAGPACTTTSAEPASSAVWVLQATRVGMGRRPPVAEGHAGGLTRPADIATLGTARVPPHGPAARGFRVNRPALQTAHALEDGQIGALVSRIRV